MSKVQLGQKVMDEITGFTGIVTGRYEYLYGCVRCAVQPQELRDGKPIEHQVFDEGQLVVVVPKPAAEVPREATGGPRKGPPEKADPGR